MGARCGRQARDARTRTTPSRNLCAFNFQIQTASEELVRLEVIGALGFKPWRLMTRRVRNSKLGSPDKTLPSVTDPMKN